MRDLVIVNGRWFKVCGLHAGRQKQEHSRRRNSSKGAQNLLQASNHSAVYVPPKQNPSCRDP